MRTVSLDGYREPAWLLLYMVQRTQTDKAQPGVFLGLLDPRMKATRFKSGPSKHGTRLQKDEEVWTISPGKLARASEVWAENKGNLEWVEEETGASAGDGVSFALLLCRDVSWL